MRTADIILVRGNEGLSHEIEWITNSPYSHVAGIISKHHLVEAQGFRKTGYKSLYAYKGVSDVFTCDILTDKQRIEIKRFVEEQIGTQYNYLLIGWELIHYIIHLDLPFEVRKKFICSTLWVEAYRSVGIDLCPGKKYPSPGDIGSSTLLRKYNTKF